MQHATQNTGLSMISVCDLWKSFKTTSVLSGTSFHIKKGETIGLLGANGAGKTTLFRIMCGLMQPEDGMVYLNNKSPQNISQSDLAVFFGGSARVYDRLTARENITYFAKLNSVETKLIRERIDFFSSLLSMEAYLDRRSMNFSHGMKQKTALVRMIVTDPEILLLDEPTTGMDIPSIESVLTFVKNCSGQGKTILYSSHSVHELEKICDRIIILHNGMITDSLSIQNEDLEVYSETELKYLERIKNYSGQARI